MTSTNSKNATNAMSDPKHPTQPQTTLFDPDVDPPPRGVNLLLVNEGGVLIVGPWYPGAQAWGYKPRIPQSVKDKQRACKQEAT